MAKAEGDTRTVNLYLDRVIGSTGGTHGLADREF
jgi:hypothetical protein